MTSLGCSTSTKTNISLLNMKSNNNKKIILKPHTTMTNSYNVVLPASIGDADQVLKIASVSDNTAICEWGEGGGGAPDHTYAESLEYVFGAGAGGFFQVSHDGVFPYHSADNLTDNHIGQQGTHISPAFGDFLYPVSPPEIGAGSDTTEWRALADLGATSRIVKEVYIWMNKADSSNNLHSTIKTLIVQGSNTLTHALATSSADTGWTTLHTATIADSDYGNQITRASASANTNLAAVVTIPNTTAYRYYRLKATDYNHQIKRISIGEIALKAVAVSSKLLRTNGTTQSWNTGGKVLQVKHVVKQGHQYINSSTLVNVTGLAITMSTSSASNSILVTAMINANNRDVTYFGITQIDSSENETQLRAPGIIAYNGTGSYEEYGWIATFTGQNTHSHTHSTMLHLLVSPGSTDTFTYQITAASHFNPGRVRQLEINNGIGSGMATVCTMTCMEVET